MTDHASPLEALRELATTAQRTADELGAEIDRALQMVRATVARGGTLLFCGSMSCATCATAVPIRPLRSLRTRRC